MGKCELEVLIATFGSDGLQRVASMKLPCMSEVKYLVSCQHPNSDALMLPPKLIREDIRVVFTPSKGLSKNRNNALSYATAPLCLISDDDLDFTESAFRNIISTFRDNPQLDIATFEYVRDDGSYAKRYPETSFSLSNPAKGYFVTSFEITFRRQPVIDSGVVFNEKFGLGCPIFGSGEEELWIKDLLDAGLSAYFFPYVIATHCGSTTGLRLQASPSVLRAQGAVIKRLYPFTAFVRVVLKAWRSSRTTGVGLIKCLRPIIWGWWQATRNAEKLFYPYEK